MNSPMIQIVFIVFMVAIGAILGSFACCQAWRIFLSSSGKKQVAGKQIGSRSICISCGHRLSFFENIPVISWITLRGKCKSCGEKIGLSELLSEISLAIVFLFLGLNVWSYILTIRSFDLSTVIYFVKLIILIICLVCMWIIMIYDAKWGKMPTFLLVITNILAVLFSIINIFAPVIINSAVTNYWTSLSNLALSAIILAGVYFLLYFFSHEKLVGGGDWILALAIAIILGHWWLALIALFLSNFLASIYGIVKKIRTGNSVIYFGPFLVIAFIITFLCQNWLFQFCI